MRVVYVLNTLAMGGTERQVLAIAERMAARGHAIALLVLKPREADHLTTTVEVVHLDMGKSAGSVIAGARRGILFLRTFCPEIIHSHNFHGNMLARMLRLFHRRARLISTIHNVYEGGRLRMLAYRLTDFLVDRSSAVSQGVAERFVRARAVGKDKCIVVTNGIDVAGFVPDKERRAAVRAQMGAGDAFVWVTVGRLTPAKDLKNLLEALGYLCQDQNVQLWVAGEAPAGSSGKYDLIAMGSPEGARRNIRWLGLRRDIPALLDAADAFVLASAWEGMPLALGEAMAMAKPVVATDVGGVRELAGDAGVLVPAKDPNALATAMLRIMDLPDQERSALGARARARIENQFNMDDRAGEWEALYQAVIGHSVVRAPVVP